MQKGYQVDTPNLVVKALNECYPGAEILSTGQLLAAGIETRNRHSLDRLERSGLTLAGKVQKESFYAMPGVDVVKMFPTRGHLLDYVAMTRRERELSLVRVRESA